MSENTDKSNSKLGSNPLGGGALDWLDEEPAPPAPKRKARQKTQQKTPSKAQPAKKHPAKKRASRSNAKPEAKASAKARSAKARSDVAQTSAGGGGTEDESRDRADSTRRGVAAGYRRHTLLMREDQIDQLDRLYALEKLNAGAEARTKKDLVEEAFDLFFQSESSEPRGTG